MKRDLFPGLASREEGTEKELTKLERESGAWVGACTPEPTTEGGQGAHQVGAG